MTPPTQAAADALATWSRTHRRGDPQLGWTVHAVDTSRRRITAEARFLRGHRYCCAEPRCHGLEWTTVEHWAELRHLLAHRSVQLGPRAWTIELGVHVERGVVLDAHRSLGLPAVTESAQDYDPDTFVEPRRS